MIMLFLGKRFISPAVRFVVGGDGVAKLLFGTLFGVGGGVTEVPGCFAMRPLISALDDSVYRYLISFATTKQ
jgi:hypothetical protein